MGGGDSVDAVFRHEKKRKKPGRRPPFASCPPRQKNRIWRKPASPNLLPYDDSEHNSGCVWKYRCRIERYRGINRSLGRARLLCFYLSFSGKKKTKTRQQNTPHPQYDTPHHTTTNSIFSAFHYLFFAPQKH